jgi:hypothetical protein
MPKPHCAGNKKPADEPVFYWAKCALLLAQHLLNHLLFLDKYLLPRIYS